MAKKSVPEAQVFASLDEKGREVLDPVPMAPPVGYVRQPSMVDLIRHQVRTEMSRRAQEVGMDSFEDADDFDVGEDYDPRSVHELDEEERLETNRQFARRMHDEIRKQVASTRVPPEEAPKDAPPKEAPKEPTEEKKIKDITST